MITKGSQISSFPDSIPNFTAQSEARDSVAGDNTLAEGKDANKWSAEIEAISNTIGIGGRAYSYISGANIVVESLKYTKDGALVIYAGTTSLSYFSSVVNYIYLDVEDNTAKVSLSGFPLTRHIPIGIYDGVSSIVEFRPHDLGIAGEYLIRGAIPGDYIENGFVLIADGNSVGSANFSKTFDGYQSVQLTCYLPSDNTPRIPAISSISGTVLNVKINSNAPAGGVLILYRAMGQLVEVTSSGS